MDKWAIGTAGALGVVIVALIFAIEQRPVFPKPRDPVVFEAWMAKKAIQCREAGFTEAQCAFLKGDDPK